MPTIKTSISHAKAVSDIILKYLRKPRFRHFAGTIPFTLDAFAKSQETNYLASPAAAARKHAHEAEVNPLQTYFDSVKEGPGIWKWLHYFDIYHRHFSKFIGREVNIVEVGIYSGGSLGMWRSYFGPKCKVYGVDIEEACKTYENDYTKIFVGDQADRGFWQRFKQEVPAVDILVDDGGHLPAQQIVTLEEMLPHLRPGGVFLCEDIQGIMHKFSAYVHGLANNLNAWEAAARMEGKANKFQSAVQSIHLYPFIAVIEKAEAPVSKFYSVKHGTQWQPFTPRAKSIAPLDGAGKVGQLHNKPGFQAK